MLNARDRERERERDTSRYTVHTITYIQLKEHRYKKNIKRKYTVHNKKISDIIKLKVKCSKNRMQVLELSHGYIWGHI